MTQEQRERAARVLENLSPNDIEYSDLRGNFFPDGIDEAIQLAINALREPKPDSVTITLPNDGMCALVKKIDGRYEIDTGRVERSRK